MEPYFKVYKWIKRWKASWTCGKCWSTTKNDGEV